MKKKIKILEVIDSLGWCGTKEQTYLITKNLAKYFDVDLALAFNHNEMISKLEGKVPLKFYEYDNGSKRRFNIKNYLRLYKIIKSGNYDVVIANSSWSLNYVLLIYPFLRKKPKLIAMRRSGYLPSLISKYLKYRFADKIVVVSKDVGELLKRENFYPEKLVVIQSGVEIDRFLNNNEYRDKVRKELRIRDDENVFINVANFQKRKGQDILLKAFKELNCDNCKLILVGHDTNSKEALELIKSLGLEDKVLTLGYRTDIEKLLQGADYFVLSSRSEGIAGALLQAMASGKVVISTLVGGIGEYLKDGINGFTCLNEDWKCLADKMKKVLSLNGEEYDNIKKKAIDTAKNYSIENTTKKWKDLILDLINFNLNSH